jgi:ATP-binding cassette subfamily B protein
MIPELFGFLYHFIFVHLLLKNENSVTDIEIGKVITRLLIIPDVLKNIIVNFTTWFFPRMMVIVVVNIYFCYLNLQFGLTSIALVIIYFISIFHIFYPCLDVVKQRHEKLEELNQRTEDKLLNKHSIYSAGYLNEEISDYKRKTNEYTDFYKNTLSCLKWNTVIATILFISIYILLHVFSTYLFWLGEIDIFLLIAILITIVYYIPCIYAMNSIVPDFMADMGVIRATDGFIRELYTYHALAQPETTIDNKLLNGEIHIHGLSFGFVPDKLIFDNFNLTIYDRERVAIAGPSGNGKTTLIKLIMGFLPVPDNTITIGGHDINHYSLNELRKQITYVNQNTKLFDATVLDNIVYGNPNASREDVDHVLKTYGLGGIFKNMDPDHFLDTPVGVEGSHLSGGQRQMILILRAILKHNPIVILDEPTSAIDKDNKTYVVRAIEVLSEHSTLILITHDNDLLQLVDRTVQL